MAFTTINTNTPRGSTTSSNNVDSITFKVFSSEHDETRLFLMPRGCISFPAVAERIAELFGFAHSHSLQVQYKDDEDDLVTVTTDEELRSALQLFAGKPSLRLIVSFNNKKSTMTSASKVVSIEPEHAESVVHVSNNTNSSIGIIDAALEEASEKLVFVDPTSSSSASPAAAVEQNAVDVNTTTAVRSEPVVVVDDNNNTKKDVDIDVEKKNKTRPALTKEERIKLREQRLAKKAQRESMAAGLQKLEEMGFTGKRGLCVRLLVKYDGDVDQVAMEMKAWAQAREAQEKLKVEREQKKKLKEEYMAKKALVISQKKEIFEEKKKRRELMLEKKKLKEELKQERALKKAEILEKRKLLKQALLKEKELTKITNDSSFGEEYKTQLATLESMGFTCKHRNVRLLKKVDGDVTKVIDLLAFKEKERLQAFAERKDLNEFEAANRAAFARLAELGHVNKRLNYRLLKQKGGDVDKVILQLRIIEERKRHRAEMTKLLGTGTAPDTNNNPTGCSACNNGIVASQEAVVVGC